MIIWLDFQNFVHKLIQALLWHLFMLQIERKGILEILLSVQLNHCLVVLIAILICHRWLRFLACWLLLCLIFLLLLHFYIVAFSFFFFWFDLCVFQYLYCLSRLWNLAYQLLKSFCLLGVTLRASDALKLEDGCNLIKCTLAICDLFDAYPYQSFLYMWNFLDR